MNTGVTNDTNQYLFRFGPTVAAGAAVVRVGLLKKVCCANWNWNFFSSVIVNTCAHSVSYQYDSQ